MQLLDLIELEIHRGIICKDGFLTYVKHGFMPKAIKDTRGALRMTVERDGEGYNVTQHPTELANESLNAIA